MQSWQTDLLNLQLNLTVKPMFKYVSSLERIRQLVRVSDNTVGRLAIPRGTRREAVPSTVVLQFYTSSSRSR